MAMTSSRRGSSPVSSRPTAHHFASRHGVEPGGWPARLKVAALAMRRPISLIRAGSSFAQAPLNARDRAEDVAQMVARQRADGRVFELVIRHRAGGELFHVVADPQLERELERISQGARVRIS